MVYRTENFNPSEVLTLDEVIFLQDLYAYTSGDVTNLALGSGITSETPGGLVDAVNTTFTVTAEPLFVISDGAFYVDGNGYTYTPLTVEMDIPPSQYIRAFI